MNKELTKLSDMLDELENLKSFNDILIEAINTTHEGIALLDSEGCYTYMNKAHATMFGYTYDEMIGQHWRILYSESDLEWFGENVFPIIAKEGKWSGEATAIHKDGKTLIYEDLYLTSLKNGGLICTCRDKNINHKWKI
jgi:PAS domain S-box-containing protein